YFFFSSRRRHTRWPRDWSSDVCSSDLNAPRVKIQAIQVYGGKITFCEPKVSSRKEVCDRVQEETGAYLVHPYDDDRIIAGQATAAKEFLEEIPDLDAVFAPVSGGGLLSGTCL